MEFGKKETENFEEEEILFDSGMDVLKVSSSVTQAAETTVKETASATASAVAEGGAAAAAPYVELAVKAAETGEKIFEKMSDAYRNEKQQREAENSRPSLLLLLLVMVLFLLTAIVITVVSWIMYILTAFIPMAEVAKREAGNESAKYIEWCGEEYMQESHTARTACEICEGAGTTLLPEYTDACEHCEGLGYVVIYDGDGGGDYWLTSIAGCRFCGGSGQLDMYRGPDDYDDDFDYVKGGGSYGDCKNCNGTGYTETVIYETYWSAAFVSWCANECTYMEHMNFPKTNSVEELYAWLELRGSVFVAGTKAYEPKPGDLIFFGDKERIGIITSYSDSEKKIFTAEGEGETVVEKEYDVADEQIYAYANPQYPILIDVVFEFLE